jgi:catechol 2,3-dioxygenase-like lactoylglutathione lyase family enzyme
VADLDAAIAFYTRVLGMEVVTFGAGRRALRFGSSKINLHEVEREFEPKARPPTPGSGDLCVSIDESIAEVVSRLAQEGVALEEAPWNAPAQRADPELLPA